MLRSVLLALCIATIAASSTRAADPIEIQLVLKNHTFEPKEPKAPANQPLLIVVTNQDDTPEEFESTPLKLEKIVTPGGSIKLRVRGLEPGRYDFFGEYNESAKGTLVVE